jgi:hypothetical protein
MADAFYVPGSEKSNPVFNRGNSALFKHRVLTSADIGDVGSPSGEWYIIVHCI